MSDNHKEAYAKRLAYDAKFMAALCSKESEVEEIDNLVSARIVEVMNRAIGLDRGAVEALCSHRVYCDEELARDATIQVQAGHNSTLPPTIGLIGILSGIAGCHEDSFSRIAAEYDTVCPNCSVAVEGPVDSDCIECGTKIVLGPLKKFIMTRVKK